MRRRLIITTLLTLLLMFVPLAGVAEPAPLPVKSHEIQLGSPELPVGVGLQDPEVAIESAAVPTDKPFDMVGVTWGGEPNETDHDYLDATQDLDGTEGHAHNPVNAIARVRASADGVNWTEWFDLTKEADLPDPNTEEAKNQVAAAGPAYLGNSNHIQIQWSPGQRPRGLPRVHLLETKGRTASMLERAQSILKGIFWSNSNAARASSPQPPITMRPQWGADESIRRADPSYGLVRAGVVHHTVSSNSYGCGDSASIVRGIYSFHVNGNGWNDIGYNFLVDRCGQIFEGRYGGIDKAVIGAHASNFNYATTGVAMIGDFSSASMPGAMYNGLVSILDWKLDLHGVNPLWQSTITGYDGSPTLTVRNVSGHRDVGQTACPGNGVYATLNSVASDAYNRGGQKIFAPGATPHILNWNGSGFGPTTIAGHLKYSQPWTIRIFDSAWSEIRSYSGTGNYASAAWNGNADIGQLVLEGTYFWRIESGDARPAIGAVTIEGGHRFNEYLLAYNPLTTDAQIAVTFMNNSGVVATPVMNVPARSRATLNVNGVKPWMELSARAEATSPVLMERAMYYNYQGVMDGGNAGFGAPTPGTDWYFAEGYTGPGFFQYLTLLNPNPHEVTATIRYLFNPSGIQVQTRTLPARTRSTVDVNAMVGPNRELATHVNATSPIVVERPQYYVFRGQAGGDNSLGARELSTEWNFAEGYTGPGFSTWITLGNPTATNATATLTFFGNNGIINTITRPVLAGGRTTVDVNAIVGPNREVSARITADKPIVAERPVYFGYMGGINGGHVALGNAGLQSRYDFAEGYTAPGFDEYLTILNPDPNNLNLDVTYAFASAPPMNRQYEVPGNTRMTIPVHNEVNRIGDVSVTLQGNHPFAAERPMYFVYRGAWRGGSNVQGGPAPTTIWYFAEGYTG